MEQLRQLAEQRDAGILSEEKFTSKKAEILARM
ncbi:SHOCT domain-containing protein [Streptomyces nigra]